MTIFGDIINQFLTPAEAGRPQTLLDIVAQRRGIPVDAVNYAFAHRTDFTEAETPKPSPEVTPLHTEVAKSALSNMPAESVSHEEFPVVQPPETDAERIDRLLGEINYIHEEGEAA
jgi:hypothetical protein